MENVSIENARIIFRNFSGKPDKFNPKGGRRGFNVILDNEQADMLQADGWNIKQLRPRDEEDAPTPFLPVRVNYGTISPRIYMVTKRNKTLLDDDTVGMLDDAEILNVDLVVRPYEWDVQGKTGVTAYVKTMYVTIAEDEFADKYADNDDMVPWNN